MSQAQIPVFTLLILTAVSAVCAQMVNSEHRIILVGHEWSGKRTAGNIILGKEVFKNNLLTTNTVDAYQCETGTSENGGRTISIVTTPGLGENLNKDMKDCVVFHSFPGPHAFLLVINVKERFTEEEKAAVKWIENNFGPDASFYTILLFTHTEQLQGKSLGEYISESEHLLRLKQKCRGRYHGFNNQLKDRSQVSELLQKIEKMVQGNGGHYANDMYKGAQRRIEEQVNFINTHYALKGQDPNREIIDEDAKQKCKEYLKTQLHTILDFVFGFLPNFIRQWLLSNHCSPRCFYEILKEELEKLWKKSQHNFS